MMTPENGWLISRTRNTPPATAIVQNSMNEFTVALLGESSVNMGDVPNSVEIAKAGVAG